MKNKILNILKHINTKIIQIKLQPIIHNHNILTKKIEKTSTDIKEIYSYKNIDIFQIIYKEETNNNIKIEYFGYVYNDKTPFEIKSILLRKGLAKNIMNDFIKKCKDNKINSINLYVAPREINYGYYKSHGLTVENMTKFYEKFNFISEDKNDRFMSLNI